MPIGLKTAIQDQDGPAEAGPRARATAYGHARTPANTERPSEAQIPDGQGRDDPFTNHPRQVLPGIDAAPLRGTPPCTIAQQFDTSMNGHCRCRLTATLTATPADIGGPSRTSTRHGHAV